ncbi:hypothetical protein [Streptomyces europaeiscabiei]|uniref:hypothetical protein n=1 Tax=Streptomyces europaeiscabiei TaxID=146819 RepID=UPI0029BDB095|nr:hypothetical protein [Streptomyces europaeiscabiei]MDX2771981.1 hypothetical protein [Streptomyces europaeiscabiei]
MAETIYIRGEGGGIHAMDLPLHESVQDRLSRGLIHRVNEDGSHYTGSEPAPADPGAPATPAEPTAGRPAVNAPKSEWIAHVVARGLMSADDAANLTKVDLIDLAS